MAIVVAGYLRLGSSIYPKIDGHLGSSTRLIMGPILLGQYFSLLHYRRKSESWSRVSPNVWIGAQLNDHEAAEAVRAGVTAVLDLTAEFSEPKVLRSVTYRNIPVLDLTELTGAQLRGSADFIAQHAGSGIVYVHCKAGYSRSAAAVGVYLIRSGRAASVEEALEILRRIRPGIVLRPEVSAALKKFCRNDEKAQYREPRLTRKIRARARFETSPCLSSVPQK
jgi:protein phosphatase